MANCPWYTLPLELHDHVMDSLSTIDLYRLRGACTLARDLVNNFLDRVMTPSSLLKNWFSEEDMAVIRKFQAESGLVFSGSAVLQFAGRLDFVPRNLDCYVPIQHCISYMSLLLLLGYSFIPEKAGSTTNPTKALGESMSLEGGLPEDMTSASVPSSGVGNTGGGNIRDSNLPHFDGSFNKLLPLYACPDVLRPKSQSRDFQIAMEKYQGRGFSVVKNVTFASAFDVASEFSVLDRHVGDSIWRVKYETLSWQRVVTRSITTLDRVDYCVSEALHESLDDYFVRGNYFPCLRLSSDVNITASSMFHRKRSSRRPDLAFRLLEGFANADIFIEAGSTGLTLPSAAAGECLYETLTTQLRRLDPQSLPSIGFALEHVNTRPYVRVHINADKQDAEYYERGILHEDNRLSRITETGESYSCVTVSR
ncbi:hypothetical protein MPER_11545 [Moniliophthora perniciosa FA553]|nr:hypothetical protein MPER_11545 [Moniliophthora perniciosa FA553]